MFRRIVFVRRRPSLVFAGLELGFIFVEGKGFLRKEMTSIKTAGRQERKETILYLHVSARIFM